MRTLTVCVVLLGMQGTLVAQNDCAVPRPCCQPQPSCCQSCGRKPCCCPPQEARAQAAPPMGMFAAPQAAGEVAGESTSVGIRGLTLRLPAVSLSLPTIQFPSLVRYRRDAEMYVDSATAPYVAGPAAVYGQVGPGGHAYTAQQLSLAQQFLQPQAAASSCNSSAHAEAEKADLERTVREQNAEIERMQRTMRDLLDCLKRIEDDAIVPAPPAESRHAPPRTLDGDLEPPAELEFSQRQREVSQLQDELVELQRQLADLQQRRAEPSRERQTSSATWAQPAQGQYSPIVPAAAESPAASAPDRILDLDRAPAPPQGKSQRTAPSRPSTQHAAATAHRSRWGLFDPFRKLRNPFSKGK